MRKLISLAVGGILGGVFLVLGSSPSFAIDWGSVTGRTVTVFYPGQASWEWALSKNEHSAATKFRQGKNCRECHEQEQHIIGEVTATGKRWEPSPIPNKRGSVPVDVKFAHDASKLYVRFEWEDVAPSGNPPMDKEFQGRVTMMWDDDNVIEFKRAGCWSICHDDVNGMASAKEGVDTHKYLARTRTKVTRNGGEGLKDKAAIEEMFNSGQFIEYWQARLRPDGSAVAVDGRTLAKREDNATPVVAADVSKNGNKWVVVLSRALDVGKPGYKVLAPGKNYKVGFAIHEDHAKSRRHQVSLEYSLTLDGGDGDFVAKGQ